MQIILGEREDPWRVEGGKGFLHSGIDRGKWGYKKKPDWQIRPVWLFNTLNKGLSPPESFTLNCKLLND